MAAHRYWRVNIATCSAGRFGALSEIQFLSDSVNRIGSGTALALSAQSANGASAAVDGSIETYWGGLGPLPVWWGYDFGLGVAWDISTVIITAGAGLEPYHPATWSLDASDDGTTWTTEQAYTSATWVANIPQVFDVSGSDTPITASPGAGAISYQGAAPALPPVIAAPGAGLAAFQGAAPTLGGLPVIAAPGAGLAAFQGAAPTLEGVPVTVAPGAGLAAFQGAAPAIAAEPVAYTYTPATAPLARTGTIVLRSRGVLAIYNPAIDNRDVGFSIACAAGDLAAYAQGYAQIEFSDFSILQAGPAPIAASGQQSVATFLSFPGSPLIVWTPVVAFQDSPTPLIASSPGGARGVTGAPSVQGYDADPLDLFGAIAGAIVWQGNPLAPVTKNNAYPPNNETLCLSPAGVLTMQKPWPGPDVNYYAQGPVWCVGDYLQTGKFAGRNAFMQSTYGVPRLVIADGVTGDLIAALAITALSDPVHNGIWQEGAALASQDLAVVNLVVGAPHDPPYGFLVKYLNFLFVIGADASWYECYTLTTPPRLADPAAYDTFGNTASPPYGSGATVTLNYAADGGVAVSLLNSQTQPGMLLSGVPAGPAILPAPMPLPMMCVPCAPVLFDPPH